MKLRHLILITITLFLSNQSSVHAMGPEPKLRASGYMGRYFDNATSWALSSFFVTKATVDEGYHSIKSNISGLWSNVCKLYGRIKKSDENIEQALKNLDASKKATVTFEKLHINKLEAIKNDIKIATEGQQQNNLQIHQVGANLEQTAQYVQNLRLDAIRNNAVVVEDSNKIRKLTALLNNLSESIKKREPRLQQMLDQSQVLERQFKQVADDQEKFSKVLDTFRVRFYANLGKKAPMAYGPLMAAFSPRPLPYFGERNYVIAFKSNESFNHIEQIDQ